MTGRADVGLDRERLAEEAVAPCRRIARVLTRDRPREFEEAVAAGMLGVASALSWFDPAKSSHWVTYRNKAIVRHILGHLDRARPKWKGRVAACDGREPGREPPVPLSVLERAGRELGVPADEEPVGWSVEWEDWVEGLARALPRRHAAVFRDYYLRAGETRAASAMASLGRCREQVYVMLGQSHAMIRSNLRNKGRGLEP